jgi:hypothetical protein
VLDTILAERSVARGRAAAARDPVGDQQRAGAAAVALGDPLVTRQGRGIVPTPRALELAPALARVMTELDRAIAAAPFAAASCTRTFTSRWPTRFRCPGSRASCRAGARDAGPGRPTRSGRSS